MTRNEFMTEAILRVSAALVKCYDESVAGITDCPYWQRVNLANNACNIAQELMDTVLNRNMIDFDD